VVAGIAARWGVERRPIGKIVWAVLPLPDHVRGRLRCDRVLASSGARDSSLVVPRGPQTEVGAGDDSPSTGLPEGGRGLRGAPALPQTTSLSGQHRDREYRTRAENRANVTRQRGAEV
jgi:hypothetical protein